MKQWHFILSASIAAALAGATVMARPAFASNLVAAAGTSEAPRVTQTINNQLAFPVAKTHLKFIEKTAPTKPLADSFKMNHLQLVLKLSASRQAALASLIADQHNPKSSRFNQWLTPAQFGEAYGVMDSDIAAVTSWLQAQGFTVNNVYPNKSQIDFSGTAGQVNATFHTQENIYDFGTGNAKEQHIANAGDISVPVALKDVVAGVMGLNDFHPKTMAKTIKSAQWDAAKKSLVSSQSPASGKADGKSMAISVNRYGANPQGTFRVLVPNDLATMYGIKTIRGNGVTGKGVTIALVEGAGMIADDWTNFTTVFNLAKYGGTLTQFQPAPPTGTNNCLDPNVVYGGQLDNAETVVNAEWATAIAPGANIQVAACSDYDADFNLASSNFFGGVFIAATNLVNEASGRPDIISATNFYGEYFTDSASKTAIDLMWAQADAEGISVFVATGDSGSNPSFASIFEGSTIQGAYGNTAVDANALATSPNVTAVGGTDLADMLDGTTSKYFAATPSVVGGSALSYVPEIPWNESCGNGVAATSMGYTSAVGFCNAALAYALHPAPVLTPLGYEQDSWQSSLAGGGGPSSVDPKPTWQRQVYNAAADQSRDVPDVALFAGSFGDDTFVATCSYGSTCTSDFTPGTLTNPNPSGVGYLSGGTSVSTPMFAGIQALIDQGLAARGLPLDQGNAAPTLYALAANEYGGARQPNSASLSACNANNGADGTSGCVFHNITRGSNSTGCYSYTGTGQYAAETFETPNCYYYNSFVIQNTGYDTLTMNVGLTTSDANPTSYTPANKGFSAQPGWSFASGLGSVNATNLLIAWRAYVHAPPAP